ncbi:hypothetical protein SS1G_03237 [Sclerotinia sclerotiorum 1980 UF-70]|uniref:Translation initiation factor 3 N-terminal domain-containing protein n=2 Tax=Sclerotinia sclerotiorum (strain ATCC 18683 / 1980 / Ss-1) TaxID=665079 RepID=A7ED48_SCLS1|nr:hypothetical protein SS1G_03237 [Sclerotinia sclerotiorum 1980 UF-70]APA11042.1 hypothetical protein sscle_07g058120 [Sclerotinia sclerotiorum 1980 UF-70]EDO00764.1 hypothetical protein SS1G_03237 [Sclerotinia sclerotiorum 1980 UF-70]
MSTTRCVFNAASALRRVFLAPIDHTSTPLLRPLTFSSHLTRIHASRTQQHRTLLKSTSHIVPEQRLPRDEEIKDLYVRLKNSEQRLDPPKATSEILKSINLKTHMLQIIAYSDDGEPPIAKIIDKGEAARQKRLAKKKKNPATVTKTIEMNWAIGKNDLSHRLQRIREFLEKGNKVEVVLAEKRKGRRASGEEAGEVIGKVREFVEGVEGARESRGMEGTVGTQAVLYFEGRVVGKKGKGEEGEGEGEKQDGEDEKQGEEGEGEKMEEEAENIAEEENFKLGAAN